MTFEELLALLREPGETEISPTIFDDLTNAHTQALDGAAEKVAQVETVNADLLADIARLKSLNFDLLMAAGEKTESDTKTTTLDDVESAPSIDDLFEKGK